MAAPLPATARSTARPGLRRVGGAAEHRVAQRPLEAGGRAGDRGSRVTCQFCGASPEPDPAVAVGHPHHHGLDAGGPAQRGHERRVQRQAQPLHLDPLDRAHRRRPHASRGELGDPGVALVGRYAGQPGQHHQRERLTVRRTHDRHVVGVVVDPAGLVGDRRALRQPGRDPVAVGLAAHHVLDLARAPGRAAAPHCARRGGVDDAGVGGRLVADHPAHLRHHRGAPRPRPVCSMTRLVARLPESTIERRRSSRSVLARRRARPRCRGPGRRPRRARTAPRPPPSRSPRARGPTGRGRAPRPPSRPAPSSGWRPAPARRRPAPTTSCRPGAQPDRHDVAHPAT